jgi:hypothetical protein
MPARRKTMKQMGDESFDPTKIPFVGPAAETVAKVGFMAAATVGDYLGGGPVKSRKSRQLPKLFASGASLDTMAKWYTEKYPKKNKGGR